MIKDDKKTLKEQHSLCPQHPDTWCKYWQDQINNTNNYNDDKRLPSVFQKILKPIFDRLSDDALLKRCLMGVTQNQNEALHGMLWGQCPKTQFCGKRKVVIAACQTIGKFNIGASSIANLMKLCSMKIGCNTMKSLRKIDETRLKAAAVKVSKKYKNRRRHLRPLKLKKKSDSKKSDYVSRGFGLSKQPEYLESEGKKKQRGKAQKQSITASVSTVPPTPEPTTMSDSAEQGPQITFVTPLLETIGN